MASALGGDAASAFLVLFSWDFVGMSVRRASRDVRGAGAHLYSKKADPDCLPGQFVVGTDEVDLSHWNLSRGHRGAEPGHPLSSV